MYRDELLDLYRNPKNEGEIACNICQEGVNPNCGDKTEIFVEVEDEKIKDVKHLTEGCAISTAGISIVTEEVKGMKIDKVLELDKEWMTDKLGVEVSPMRLKCALLGLKTIQEALAQNQSE